MDFDQFEEKMKVAPLVSFEQLKQVPKARGVYTVWLEGESRCFYVGRAEKTLLKRIKDHFPGSRGGDQFCLYVYDLYIHQRRPDGLKTREVNNLTRDWIRKNIKFRWVELPESDIVELEDEMKKRWKPILNPL